MVECSTARVGGAVVRGTRVGNKRKLAGMYHVTKREVRWCVT